MFKTDTEKMELAFSKIELGDYIEEQVEGIQNKAQLDAEIRALNADIADNAEKTFREANAKIKADQRLLKLARQKTAAAKEEFQAT